MVQEVEGMGEQVCLPFLNIVVMDGPEYAPIDAASDLFPSLCFSLVLASVLPATDFSLESGNSCIPPRMSHEVHRFSGPSARRFPSRPTKSSASLIIYRRPSKKLGQHFK